MTTVPPSPGELIGRVAERLGLGVHYDSAERRAGQLAAPDGRRFYFSGTLMDLNGMVAASMANKQVSAYHLLRMGYPVPDGRVFARGQADDAWAYARGLGLPVVVKPNGGRQGIGVDVVADERQFRRAMREIVALRSLALVQRRVRGNDFRVIVLDGEVLAAYRRVPLSVTGDGRRSIAALLRAKHAHLAGRNRRMYLAPRDYRVQHQLHRLHKTWRTVPAAGERVELLETANGSTGADLVDCTRTMHADFRTLAGRIVRDAGLRYCGLDLMTDSIETPPGDYTIIELNDAAAIVHLLGLGPDEQRLAEAIVEKMLRALVG
jgi:D-alanine-D-alanine ligase-like ATP-grasp enzyme